MAGCVNFIDKVSLAGLAIGFGDMSGDRKTEIQNTLIWMLCLHFGVAGALFVGGAMVGSLGLLAAGVHGVMSLYGCVVGLVGLGLADGQTPMSGLRFLFRFSVLSVMLFSGFLFIAGWEIASAAWVRVSSGAQEGPFSWMGLFLALGSVVVAWWIARHERKLSLVLRSEILGRDAEVKIWEAASPLVACLGLFGVKFFHPASDAVAALWVMLIWLVPAYRIVRNAMVTVVNGFRENELRGRTNV